MNLSPWQRDARLSDRPSRAQDHLGEREAYGTLALVFDLLSWFRLFSPLVLLAAEVNGVLPRRL